VVTGDSSPVTLTIAAQPGRGATLGCAANPVTASSGVASFAGCEITGKTGGYTLEASDASLAPATSSAVSIAPGAAAKLAFAGRSFSGRGRAWPTAPIVFVEDSAGNVVTDDSSAVTLSIVTRPGSRATLGCTANPVTATNGVATFAGCTITGGFGRYTLIATDGSLISATSRPGSWGRRPPAPPPWPPIWWKCWLCLKTRVR
jgi:trimeric autotransporter adhesin